MVEVALFANNLNTRMFSYGISNAEMAKFVGVSRQVVSQWRKGHTTRSHSTTKCLPSRSKMLAISQKLHCGLDDLILPQYASNLRRLLARHHLSRTGLAGHLGVNGAIVKKWLDGLRPPSRTHAVAICGFLNGVHQTAYDVKDIFDFPDLIPIRTWAKREGIPLARAQALFDLKLLTGAIESPPFGLLIPGKITAPKDSKHLVTMRKRRPRWGEVGLNLDSIMSRGKGISNEELANQVGVNLMTVSHWRSGLRTPAEEYMPKIAEVCGCTVEEMIAG